MLLVGEAGIGKSRVSRALLDAVAEEPHFRIRYECLPYHAALAGDPAAESRGGPRCGTPALELKLDKLEALLERAGVARPRP